VSSAAPAPGPANPGPASAAPAHPEAIFTYGAPQLKFGPGASDEIGYDLSQYGVRRALVVTDPGVAATGIPQRVADQMAQFGIEARVFGGVRVEPTDESMHAAVEQARASGPALSQPCPRPLNPGRRSLGWPGTVGAA
jgi:hypothetical protein